MDNQQAKDYYAILKPAAEILLTEWDGDDTTVTWYMAIEMLGAYFATIPVVAMAEVLNGKQVRVVRMVHKILDGHEGKVSTIQMDHFHELLQRAMEDVYRDERDGLIK